MIQVMNINKIIAIVGISSIIGVLSACSRVEVPIYDQSPTARLEGYLLGAQEALVAPEHGWEMRIYPSATMEWGGYTLLAKFGKDGRVTVASEVYGADETFTSYYKLDGSNQPMLTFDVFNKAIHLFSAPNLKSFIREDRALRGDASRLERFADASASVGLAGDYAMRITSYSAEEIVLVGARTGVRYVLTPASSTPWSQQMTQVQYMSDNYGLPLIKLSVGSEVYEGRMRYSRRQLTLEDAEGREVLSSPYRYTTHGIELYETKTLGGVNFQRFDVVDGASQPTLQTPDGKATISANVQPLNRLLTEVIDVWNIVDNQEMVEMSGRFAMGFGMFNMLQPHYAPIFGSIGMLRRMGLGFGVIMLIQNINVPTDQQLAFIPLRYKLVEGTTDQVEFSFNIDDADASSRQNIEELYTFLFGLGFANFPDLYEPDVAGPRRFTLTTNDRFNPEWIKLVDNEDPDSWIKLKRASTSTTD